jgi:quercetin dioxygenase-like cupin family protein
MNNTVLKELVKFSDQGHTKNVFFESAKIKAQVMGLEAGQQIPPCRMDHDVIFFVIEGEGKIIVDGEEEILKKTSWVFVPKEIESRSLKAETRMAILAIQIRR